MAQPEARLSRSIMAALRQRGAFVFKVWGSEHMMAGLPDIIGCYRGQFIAVETKMPGNTTSRRQDFVIDKIRRAGGRVVVAYSVREALEVLDGVVTPDTHPEALTGELRAPSERPALSRRMSLERLTERAIADLDS
jgi:Holliday junction resolvase